MLDKDQYEATQKREKNKATYAKIKKMGITCGNCKWAGKVNDKMEKLSDKEIKAEAKAIEDEKPVAPSYDMCFYAYRGVSGPIGLRGARANSAKGSYCGMEGKYFYPKSDEAAGVADRAKEKAKERAEAIAAAKAELAAEAKAAKDAEPTKPGDEELPIQKSKKSKPGQG